MKTRFGGPQGESAAHTLDDFMRTARNRDRTLRLETDGAGVRLVTNGKRRYPLPHLRAGRMPFRLVASLCEFFGLPAEDFGLDSGPES
jgi:hypothetical protein